MSNSVPHRLNNRDQIDLATALFGNREVIAVAYFGGLPHLFPRAFGRKIEAIRAVGAVLDNDLKLCAPFRAVLNSLLPDLNLNEITFDDCHQIAMHAEDWHNEPFREDWSIVVYRSR